MARSLLRPFLLVVILALASSIATAQSQHDKDFWRAIYKNHAAVPQNESADALAQELGAMVALPDPELRDELSYSILATWVYRGNVLSTPTILSLTDAWRANLKLGLGEAGTDSVLRRSFSALLLSEIAARDLKAPFLGVDRYHSLVSEATSYLVNERDLRGYDPQLHWIHATAHTADLLAALAQNPQLTKKEAASILQAIDTRLYTAKDVYTQGEQDRLAAAVIAVIRRNDFDAATFAPWLAHIQDEDHDVWTATTPEALARFQNHNYFLQALTVRTLQAKEAPQLANFRDQVLAILGKRQ